MTEKEMVQQLMDLYAKFLSLIDQDTNVWKDYFTNESKEKEISEFYEYLKGLYKVSLKILLNRLEHFWDEIKAADSKSRSISAVTTCIWIDSMLTYEKDSENLISLDALFSESDSDYFVVYALNSNVSETNIWVNPKLRVQTGYDPIKCREEETKLTDSFWGLNEKLNNTAYFIWDGTLNIKNVIYSDMDEYKPKDRDVVIAFSPITNEQNLLTATPISAEQPSFVELELKYGFDFFADRLRNDWLLAAKKKADVFFMPEMLGTEESFGAGKDYIDWVSDLSEENMDGLHMPNITILPSYWHDRSNSSTIVAGDGRVLSVQYKYTPYESEHTHSIEALKPCSSKEITIIHLPDAHRLSVIICSDFVKDPHTKWSEILCRCLCVSFIIVPSYSPSEKGFSLTVGRYKEYGTSVFWGNCCGAGIHPNKIIGVCALSWANNQDNLGKACKCQYSCAGINSCVFSEMLAHTYTITRVDDVPNEHVLKHHTIQ